ncbi:MAG: flagellar hook-basal body complex protein FliE [Armatimonadota bacterium]|nr:flagellar hook-basal body complex protein FliE [bacterium]
MRITPVGLPGPIKSLTDATSSGSNSTVGQSGSGSFGDLIKTSITSLDDPQKQSDDISISGLMKKGVREVNSLQTQADNLANSLASGELEDVHKAMIAMQKAKLSFEFTVQVRNKVIEAYQEVMRMQV